MPAIKIPYQKLSPEALRGLIEEFVTREGTDSGYTRSSLAHNIEQVREQLKAGQAVIVYDPATQTANIVQKEALGKLRFK